MHSDQFLVPLMEPRLPYSKRNLLLSGDAMILPHDAIQLGILLIQRFVCWTSRIGGSHRGYIAKWIYKEAHSLDPTGSP
jgi:hypothetical protein